MPIVVTTPVLNAATPVDGHLTIGVFNSFPEARLFMGEIAPITWDVVDKGWWGANSNRVYYDGPYHNDRPPHITLRKNGVGPNALPDGSKVDLRVMEILDTDSTVTSREASARCNGCGQTGHFKKNCPQNAGRTLSREELARCDRCRGLGHFKKNCQAAMLYVPDADRAV